MVVLNLAKNSVVSLHGSMMSHAPTYVLSLPDMAHSVVISEELPLSVVPVDEVGTPSDRNCAGGMDTMLQCNS